MLIKQLSVDKHKITVNNEEILVSDIASVSATHIDSILISIFFPIAFIAGILALLMIFGGTQKEQKTGLIPLAMTIISVVVIIVFIKRKFCLVSIKIKDKSTKYYFSTDEGTVNRIVNSTSKHHSKKAKSGKK